MFYNYTNEPFVAKWGGFSYTIPAGEVRENMVVSDDKVNSVLMTDVVARVWGHHLANKVLNHPSLTQNFERGADGKINRDKPLLDNQMMINHSGNVDLLVAQSMSMPGTAETLPEQLEELPLLKAAVESEPKVSEPEAPEVVEEPVEKKRSPGRPKKEEASPSPEAEFDV